MYDAIVIGNDINSLIAALACCRQGLQTILISDGTRPAAFFASGYSFNIDPLPWSGFSGDLCHHSFLNELISDPPNAPLVPLNPAFQVVLPDRRLAIYSDRNRLIGETEREFTGSRLAVEAFYDSVLRAGRALVDLTVEFSSFRPRTVRTSPRFIKMMTSCLRERARFLKKWSTLQDDSLLRCLEAQMAFLSGYCDDGLEKTLTAPYTLSLPFQGLYYPSGGKQSFVNVLKEQILSRGGTLIDGCVITGVTLGPGQCHVEWRSGNESAEATARSLVLSTNWKNLDGFISGHKRLKSLSSRLKRTEKILYPLTLYLGIQDKGLPEQMAEYLILDTATERSLRDQSLIFIELSKRGDTGRAPDGKRALSATVFLDVAPSELADEERLGMASRLLESLKGFLPFLDESLDYFAMDQCLEMSKIFDDLSSRKYLVVRNPLNPFARSPHRTPLKNVVLTGGSLLAGLGFAGEVLSGLNAANIVSGAKP